jgi:hypothetical protein
MMPQRMRLRRGCARMASQTFSSIIKTSSALVAPAGDCRVVLYLITENWLASHECFGEFKAALYMGKRIIPLFVLPPTARRSKETEQRLASVRAHDQGVDLNPCLKPDNSLDIGLDPNISSRLMAGLRAVLSIVSDWTPKRLRLIAISAPPRPSFICDSDADAALFYGRTAERSRTRSKNCVPCEPYWIAGPSSSSVLPARESRPC